LCRRRGRSHRGGSGKRRQATRLRIRAGIVLSPVKICFPQCRKPARLARSIGLFHNETALLRALSVISYDTLNFSSRQLGCSTVRIGPQRQDRKGRLSAYSLAQ
jgi:hypothetical protein